MSSSIIVSNVPKGCTTYALNAIFNEIGDIKRCFMIKDNSNFSETAQAQVQFVDAEQAQKAVDKFNKYIFKDHQLQVQLKEVPQQNPSAKNHKAENLSAKNHKAENPSSSDAPSPLPKKKSEAVSKKKPKKRSLSDSSEKENDAEDSPAKKQKTSDEKRYNKPQDGRLIVRNMSFTTTEDDIRKFFSPYGEIVDIHIARKNFPGPRNLRGFFFVQFSSIDEAAAAIKGCNLKKFMGRFIAVDHAVPKAKYQDANHVKVAIKKELLDDTKPDIAILDGLSDVKKETGDENDTSFCSEASSKECDDSSIISPDKIKKEPYVREDPKTFKHKKVSKDVEQGRTLFISGLSIDTSQLSVESVLGKFGEIKYVALVLDKLTEQPKGTAFAQFKTTEGAEACLKAAEDPTRSSEIKVDGKLMTIKRAVGREDARTSFSGDKATKTKDKRNLYLAKEGFIRDGTQAAVGLSKFDLELRKSREQHKQRLLKSLNMFVSPLRLCINNLPLHYNDPDLRDLCTKYAPQKAKITEAKVMRYLHEVSEDGKARSRGYGFVSFKRHEHALAVLRNLNNNPEVFTAHRRPIVEFSIENKAVLEAREKRLQNSKLAKANPKKKTDVAAVASELVTNLAAKPQFAGYISQKGDTRAPKRLGAKIRRRDMKPGKNKPFFSKGQKVKPSDGLKGKARKGQKMKSSKSQKAKPSKKK